MQIILSATHLGSLVNPITVTEEETKERIAAGNRAFCMNK
jgi:hypothetical protein